MYSVVHLLVVYFEKHFKVAPHACLAGCQGGRKQSLIYHIGTFHLATGISCITHLSASFAENLGKDWLKSELLIFVPYF